MESLGVYPTFQVRGRDRIQILCVSLFFFNWSIVGSQCFNCIAKSFSFNSKDSHRSRVKSKILVIWQRPTLSSLHLVHFLVMSNSLWPHGLQHARIPCPSPTPGVYSNSCPSSWWCHPTIPFSSCLQSFPAPGSFPMSQLFTSDGQSIEASASASVLPVNIQGWFPLGLTGLISLQSKGLSRIFSNTTVQKHQFFSCAVLIRYFLHFSYQPTWKDSPNHSKSE